MFTPPPAQKKKHTEESSRPAPAPGADTMKAVQQLLQNAFQPAPQAAPPPSRKHTQESFQPASQPAPPPPPRKHTQESFQPAPSPGADTMKAVQQLFQHAFQPAPPPKPKLPEPKSAFASFASKLKEAKKLDQTPFQPSPEPSPQPKPKAPKHKPAFAPFAHTLKDASHLAQTQQKLREDSTTSASRSASTVAQPTSTPRTPEQKLLEDSKFTRLDPATQAAVLERSRALGNNPTAQPNLRNLATNDGFAQLNPTHQRAMLDIQAKAPENRKLTSQLQNLAGQATFRNLDDSVKSNALTQFGRYPTDLAARRTILQLTTAPGFALLSNQGQNRFLHYVGGTNSLSTPARQALGTVLGSTNFQRASPEQQQDQLSGFLTNQATMPRNVGNITGLGTVTRAPYTVQGPTRVENHAFRSGKTDANRYEVEIGGRRIPAYLPVAPNSANGNFHTLEQVVQGLAALPASSRALVKQVDVAPAQNPDDAYVAEQFNRPGFSSYMTAGAAGIISIYPTKEPPSQDALDTVLLHETGHILSNQAWGSDSTVDNGWGTWRTAIQNDVIRASRYATQSPEEDFSETLVIYQRTRGTPQEAEFRAMMPERFRILDGMV